MTYKRGGGIAGGLEILCIAVVVVLAAYIGYAKTEDLKQKEQEAIAKEELLQQEILDEQNRTTELEEQKKYVKTDEYIEEIAREKLGLIGEDEILFEEKED